MSELVQPAGSDMLENGENCSRGYHSGRVGKVILKGDDSMGRTVSGKQPKATYICSQELANCLRLAGCLEWNAAESLVSRASTL